MLQVPATPPGVIPAPLRNTSNSPVRQDSPNSRRRAAGISLRQVSALMHITLRVSQYCLACCAQSLWRCLCQSEDGCRQNVWWKVVNQLCVRTVQALSQPTPSRDDTLAEAALSAQAALHGTGGLPALGAVSLCLSPPILLMVQQTSQKPA